MEPQLNIHCISCSQGPLYYEVINTKTPQDIMWTVLKAKVNFNLKDEVRSPQFMPVVSYDLGNDLTDLTFL